MKHIGNKSEFCLFSLFLHKRNSQITELFETTPASNHPTLFHHVCYCNHTVSEKIRRKEVKKKKEENDVWLIIQGQKKQ